MFRKRSTKDLVRPNHNSGKNDTVEVSSPEAPADENKPVKVHKRREKNDKVQNHRLRDIFRNKSFLGGICVISALLIAFVVVPMMQRLMTTEMTTMVILNQDLAVGETITDDMVTTKEIPAFNMPETTVRSETEVVGKYVVVAAFKGDILTRNHFSDDYPGSNPQLAALPNGKLAISLSMDTLAQSVSGKLRAGDVIQLYAIFKGQDSENKSANYTAMIIPELQYVEVLSVSDADAMDVTDQSDEVQKIATITLIVNQVQAKAVAGLEAFATLHAALACRGDETRKLALLEAQEKLFDPTTASEDSSTGPSEAESTVG